MARKRKPKGARGAGRRSALKVRRAPDAGDDAWELVHPRCARSRAEDIEEVHKMVDAGETEVAVDELRWLLNGCSDFVDAHRLLGELAMADGDFRLARGHFGYAYQIVTAALPPGGLRGTLAYELPANQGFFQAAKGLVWCLLQLDKKARARDVARAVKRLDPADPLAIAGLLEGEHPPK